MAYESVGGLAPEPGSPLSVTSTWNCCWLPMMSELSVYSAPVRTSTARTLDFPVNVAQQGRLPVLVAHDCSRPSIALLLTMKLYGRIPYGAPATLPPRSACVR